MATEKSERIEKFPQRLREVRRDLKMNQEDFAALIKVTHSSLDSYEKGSYMPDIVMLKNLCEATGVSAYYMLGMSDERNTCGISNCDKSIQYEEVISDYENIADVTIGRLEIIIAELEKIRSHI